MHPVGVYADKARKGNRNTRGISMSTDARLLEKAAKYLCNTLDGLCPMMAEGYVCPTECALDTVPWRCWIAYFRDQLADPQHDAE
jgi:hypothetical protein